MMPILINSHLQGLCESEGGSAALGRVERVRKSKDSLILVAKMMARPLEEHEYIVAAELHSQDWQSRSAGMYAGLG